MTQTTIEHIGNNQANVENNKPRDFIKTRSLFSLTTKLNWRIGLFLDAHSTDKSIRDIQARRDAIIAYIEDSLSTGNSWKLEGFSTDGQYIIIKTQWEKGDEVMSVFDMLATSDDEIFKWNDLYMVQQAALKEASEISHQLEQLEDILNTLDNIFQSNLESDDTFLTPNDTENSWIDGKWQDIFQVSQVAQKLILGLDTKLDFMTHNQSLKDSFHTCKQKYLEMTMWVSQKYEGWAWVFEKTNEQITLLIDEIIKNQSLDDNLNYLVKIHDSINKNTTQSETVKRGYKILTDILHVKILEKIIRSNPENKIVLDFIKIITWRKVVGSHKVYVGYLNNGTPNDADYIQQNVVNNIQDDYRGTDTANAALAYLINRKQWIFEQLQKSDIFEMNDGLVWDRHADVVLSDTISSIQDFSQKYPEFDTKEGQINELIPEELKIKDAFNLPHKPYWELDMNQKILVSYLARIQQFLWDTAPVYIDNAREQQNKFLNRGLKDGISAQGLDIKGYVEHGLKGVFKDTQVFVSDVFESNFEAEWENPSTWMEGKGGKHFDLGDDAQIINLFNDINGMWLDMSDTGWQTLKWFSKIWAVLLVSIALAWALAPLIWGWVIAQGVIIWLISWPVSNIVMRKGYDVSQGQTEDILSDAGINVALWLIWWTTVKYIWNDALKILSNGGFHRNNLIFGSELWLWIGVENSRTSRIDKKYHWDDFFKNAWKNFYSRKSKQKPDIYKNFW